MKWMVEEEVVSIKGSFNYGMRVAVAFIKFLKLVELIMAP